MNSLVMLKEENQLHDKSWLQNLFLINWFVKLTSQHQKLSIGPNLPAFQNRIICSGKLREKKIIGDVVNDECMNESGAWNYETSHHKVLIPIKSMMMIIILCGTEQKDRDWRNSLTVLSQQNWLLIISTLPLLTLLPIVIFFTFFMSTSENIFSISISNK